MDSTARPAEVDSREERRGERLAVWVDMTGREEEEEEDRLRRLDWSAVCCWEGWAVVVVVLAVLMWLPRLGDVGGVISWMTGGLDERLRLVQRQVVVVVVLEEVVEGSNKEQDVEGEQQLDREAEKIESIPGKGVMSSALCIAGNEEEEGRADVTR